MDEDLKKSLTKREPEYTVVKPFLLAASLTATLGSFQCGFGMVALANLEDILRITIGWDEEETWRIPLLNSVFIVAGGLGAFVANANAQRTSIKSSMFVYNLWLTIPGSILMILPTYFTLLCGRFLTGFATGFISTLIPIYINEIAPRRLRGTLGALIQIVTAFAQFVYFLSTLSLSEPTEEGTPAFTWKLILLIPAVAAALQVVLLLSVFNFDTPRYLFEVGKDSQAFRLLNKLQGREEARESENELRGEKDSGRTSKISFSELWTSNWRAATIAAIGVATLMQWCGINGIMVYASEIMNGTLNEPSFSEKLRSTVYLGMANWLASCFAVPMLQRFGRRQLLLAGSLIMAMSNIMIGSVKAFDFPDIYGQIALWTFVASFEVSVGPIVWIYSAEILPGVGVALSTSCIQGNGLLIIALTPYLLQWLSYGTFWLFGFMCLAGSLFICSFVLETKGKSREEIHNQFLPRFQ